MGKTFYLVAVTGLLLFTVGTTALVLRRVNRHSSSTLRQSESNSGRVLVLASLQAHGGRSDRSWTRFFAQGTLTFNRHLSNRLLQFERKFSLASDGPVVRYDRASVDTNESYLFDGNTLVRTITQTGGQRGVKTMDGAEAAGIKSLIAACGLLPFLKRLSDPGTKAVYIGRTKKGDQFEVKTDKGTWNFYSNSNHLIERLYGGEFSITYGDYRTVDGVTLPYYQEVWKGETFLYDIKFDSFDLNPVFVPGFFKS